MSVISVVAKHLIKAVVTVYRNMIVKRHMEINFWILYMFIFGFVGARLVVRYLPEAALVINGVHIHHFAYAFMILAIVGLAGLNDWHKKYPRIIGGLYGLSLGIAFDEFGMWIHLTDDYWVRQSYDAIMVIGAILISMVYFASFWRKLFEKIIDVLRKDITGGK